jgi:hemerythrin superfamily protein
MASESGTASKAPAGTSPDDKDHKTPNAQSAASPTRPASAGADSAAKPANGDPAGGQAAASPAQGEDTANKGRKPEARAASSSPASQSGEDAVALLKADHRAVEALFQQTDSASPRDKERLIAQICKALTIHAILEEELFYPAAREAASDEQPLDEAQVEHDSAKLLIEELEQGRSGDQYREAKLKVLAEQVRHHVAEEEKARSGILARAQQAGINTPELARRMQQLKAELEQEDELPAGRPVSFRTVSRYQAEANYQAEESRMASNQTRERDARGRFTDDDDNRGGRGGRGGSGNRERDDDGRFTGSRSGSGNNRGRDDDDDRGGSRGGRGDGDDGRGWYGDPRGHSEAARRGWDDRNDDRGGSRGGQRGQSRGYDDDDRSRSRSNRDDDDRDSRGRGRGGWFGDSEGHSEASRRGWDNPDHGPSGWYGDSRGHSEASRRGWDNPDHGPSGWYGDSRGHSEASRRGWDNPDHGRSGWYGDPEGHSEASRRGWENRDDDDDDRGRGGRGGNQGGSRGGSQSRGRDDDGRFTGSRGGSSRGRDDDDDGRGWHGDSRGHSEAARKGWENRR